MNNEVLAAAQRLANVLEEENEALKRADYNGAVHLGLEKEASFAALSALKVPANFPQALARRIQSLARENQTRLALAINVQTRLMQIVARAHASPRSEWRYGAHAGGTTPTRAIAVAVSARA